MTHCSRAHDVSRLFLSEVDLGIRRLAPMRFARLLIVN
jgi:hypothetical protein